MSRSVATSRTPFCASAMIFWATSRVAASSIILRLNASHTLSNAADMFWIVSGSNPWPWPARNGRIGMTHPHLRFPLRNLDEAASARQGIATRGKSVAGNISGGFAFRWRGATSSMGRSQEYRQYAEACLAMAQTAADEVARAMLIQMARVWHRLADAHANGTDEVAGHRRKLGA
jgi:hypothetical protein